MVDTNVILRHLLNDHAEHSPRASSLFRRVRRGEEAVYCPDTAIFEAVYVLTGLAGVPRDRTVESLLPLVELPTFRMGNKEAVTSALTLWQQHSALDFADCYHLALTKALGMDAIYTFDTKMDRYPGVERIEP